jgi:hypothetical protein
MKLEQADTHHLLLELQLSTHANFSQLCEPFLILLVILSLLLLLSLLLALLNLLPPLLVRAGTGLAQRIQQASK